MSLLRLSLLSLSAVSVACSEIPVLDSRGTPCGGTRQVDAEAVFPDTGLGAGGRATVSFYESDPNRALDETAIIVWTFPPANTTFADNPPRVRVLTDGGKVFLDLQSTSAYMGSWYVRQPIPNGSLRDEIIAAFQTGIVVVELSSPQGVQKTTRVRPNVRFAGRTPVVICL